MKQQELIDFADATFQQCLGILRRKNNDYANQEALSNFTEHLPPGITPEHVFKVLFHIKDTRLENLLTREPSVTQESRHDTIVDRINYLILFAAYLKDK